MNELQVAFEQMAERGTRVGASTVVSRALATTPAVSSPVSSRRQSFVVVITVAATAAILVGAVAVVRSRVPDIERVNVSAALGEGDGVAGVMTLLVVGVEHGASPDSGVRRADAIMLLRVDRATGAVSALSLPRDLYVPLVGIGSSDRLSVASAQGENVLIQTVREVTGIAVDHYLEFDFAGFREVVDAAGGVDLLTMAHMRDELSGLDLPAGCNHLDGATALAYVRARHVLVQDSPGGAFHADPTGDLGRIGRQQLLFLVALDHLTRTRDVGRIDRIAEAIEDNVRVDERFSLRDAVDFAKNWAKTDGPLQLLVYPAMPMQLENGAAVLEPDASQASIVVDTFNNPRADQPRTGSPIANCG